MCLSVFDVKQSILKLRTSISTGVGILFVGLSVLVMKADIQYEFISFLLGLMACFFVVALMMKAYTGAEQTKVFSLFAKYTMPIFLMHTLFAAPLRTVLFRIGIQNAAVHVVLGIVISFAGPMVAAEIMKKIKWLEFFLYPGQFVRIK